MYYNDECKQKYLSEQIRKDQHNRAKKMFEVAAKREELLQLDLGMWGHDDVVWLINQLATIDLNTVKVQIVAAYTYQQWYLKEFGLDSPDRDENRSVACNQKKITREDVNFERPIKATIVVDFEQVVRALESVIALDEGLLTPPLLCFAWMNVDIEQAVRVPYDGIRWSSNMIVNDTGDVITNHIPAEVQRVLRTYEDTLVGRNGRKTVYPYHTGYFLKPFLPKGYDASHEPIKVNTAMSSLSRINQKLQQSGNFDVELTYANIQRSAQFRILLDKEPASFLSPDGRKFVETVCGNGQKDFQKSRIYDVLYIYEQYKKAFNLI